MTTDATKGSWTIQEVLRWTQQHFRERGIATPRLDAEVLLAAQLNVDRVHLYTHFDQPLSAAEREGLRATVRRRAAREPVAYILGRKEFYGRDFAVTPAVLVPRPETEHLVDAVLAWVRETGLAAPNIADIGTGSGIIGVTLAAEIQQSRVVATDVSVEALAIARQNVIAHQVDDRVHLVTGDLLAALAPEEHFDVIVSNPPYVDPDVLPTLAPEILCEPRIALVCAKRGLDLLERLCRNSPAHLSSPGLLALEIGHDQAEAVTAVLQAVGGWAKVQHHRDLQGLARVVVAERAGPT